VYLAVRKTLAEPDSFRLRYRNDLHEIVAQRFSEVVLAKLKRPHPGVFRGVPAIDERLRMFLCESSVSMRYGIAPIL